MASVVLTLSVAVWCGVPARGQSRFGDLAAGPYNRLVIRNAMVVPGHGGPPNGPFDIVISGNTITEMTPFDPVTAARRGRTERPTGDRSAGVRASCPDGR